MGREGIYLTSVRVGVCYFQCTVTWNDIAGCVLSTETKTSGETSTDLWKNVRTHSTVQVLSVSTAERKGKRTLVLCDVFSVQSLSATEWMDLKAPCFLHTPPNPLPQQNQWDNVVHYSGGQCKKKKLIPGWTSQFHFMHGWLQAHTVNHRCLPPPASSALPNLHIPPHSPAQEDNRLASSPHGDRPSAHANSLF